jgi:hypothetical protein
MLAPFQREREIGGAFFFLKIKQLQDDGNGSRESEQISGTKDNHILAEIHISLSKLAKISNSVSGEDSILKRLYFFESLHHRESSVEDPKGGSFRFPFKEPSYGFSEGEVTKRIQVM